jgi:DNA-binding transcriptional ArsR family regulator
VHPALIADFRGYRGWVSDFEERLADVERRLSALEGCAERRVTPQLAGDRQTDVLAALGNTDRVAIVMRLVEHGPQTASAVQESVGLASTGRLYHHLKTLTGSGVVSQESRGNYHVTDEVASAVTAILDAAARIASR